MVRGDGACALKSSSPAQQPAVIAAEFTALYDRCLGSGLKACVVFNHAAGRQMLTVSCSFPCASRDFCRIREAPPPSSPLSKAWQSRHRCAGCSGSGYTLYRPPVRCINAATDNTRAVARNCTTSSKKNEEAKKRGRTPAGLRRGQRNSPLPPTKSRLTYLPTALAAYAPVSFNPSSLSAGTAI